MKQRAHSTQNTHTHYYICRRFHAENQFLFEFLFSSCSIFFSFRFFFSIRAYSVSFHMCSQMFSCRRRWCCDDVPCFFLSCCCFYQHNYYYESCGAFFFFFVPWNGVCSRHNLYIWAKVHELRLTLYYIGTSHSLSSSPLSPSSSPPFFFGFFSDSLFGSFSLSSSFSLYLSLFLRRSILDPPSPHLPASSFHCNGGLQPVPGVKHAAMHVLAHSKSC